MIKKQKELNSSRMIMIYVIVSFVIFIWFFLVSIDIHIQTSTRGKQILIKKENKLPDRFYSRISKIIFTNSSGLQGSDTLSVVLERQKDDKYIYNVLDKKKIKNYNKGVVKAKIYQIF